MKLSSGSSWITKNLIQANYELKQFMPSELVLQSGTKDIDFELKKIDPTETYEFQVKVSDGVQFILSNKVFNGNVR